MLNNVTRRMSPPLTSAFLGWLDSYLSSFPAGSDPQRSKSSRSKDSLQIPPKQIPKSALAHPSRTRKRGWDAATAWAEMGKG